MKARGTKKRTSESGRQNRPSNSNDRGTSLHDSDQSVCSVDKGSTKPTKDSSLQENFLDGSKDTRTVVVKKEINILDDLEKEFNRQRQQEKKSEDWHSLMVGVKGTRGREEITLNADNRQRTDASESRSNIEVNQVFLIGYSSGIYSELGPSVGWGGGGEGDRLGKSCFHCWLRGIQWNLCIMDTFGIT